MKRPLAVITRFWGGAARRGRRTTSTSLMRLFSILMSWLNRFAKSGAKAPAAFLRKVKPREVLPKNLVPAFVDEVGGGGVWI
jgi:hypothetical protein